LAALVFWFGVRFLKNPGAGFAAAVFLVLMPRMFGHAHFVETDLMLCAVYFAAACAFLWGLESRWGSVAFGIIMGILPAVKFTGLFAFAPFFLYGILFERRKTLRNAYALALAPLVFFAVQPMYWHAPLAAASGYFGHFLDPKAYTTITTSYFGKLYPKSPPWTYPAVITALVIPLPTLLLAVAGAVASVSRMFKPSEEKPVVSKICVFVLFNALFLIILFSPERVAKYDGERLLMPIFPFWALLAGVGFQILTRRFNVFVRAAAFVVIAVMIATAVYQVRPFYLCYYNCLIGGAKGAERHGMDVMYWGEAFTPQFAARINEKIPPGARIATIGYFSGNLRYFQQMGLLRPDLKIVDYGQDADFLLAFNRNGVLDPFTRYLMQNAPPIIGLKWKGIKLAGVYLLKPGLRFYRAR